MKNGTGRKTIVCVRMLPLLLCTLLLGAGFLCAAPGASSAAGIEGAGIEGAGEKPAAGGQPGAGVGAEAVPVAGSIPEPASVAEGADPGSGDVWGLDAGAGNLGDQLLGGQADGGLSHGEQAQGGQADGGQAHGGQPDGGQAQDGLSHGGQADGGQTQDGQPDGGLAQDGLSHGGQPMGAMAFVPDGVYDAEYYVSASGSDSTGDGTIGNPWATLAKTAGIINGTEIGTSYIIYVMSDLTSTACARYYDRSATIASLGDTPFTVTRGAGFSAQSETRRGWYNPAMLEIGSTILNEGAPVISLTLGNIAFDDAYRHEGTSFEQYAPKNGTASTVFVQDAIVASYAPSASIVLDDGAELRNFGGMSAIRVTDRASLVMKGGSLVADIGSGSNTRAASTSPLSHFANGEAAVSLLNASIHMEKGSKIANIANAHGIKLSGTYKCFMDGEISGMVGNKGMDTNPGGDGRGFKNAMMFNDKTLDPETGEPGPAVIGKNGLVTGNATKSGAVAINRAADASLKIYGKVNGNKGGTGSTLNLAGTNGGGLFVVGAGTIYLEEGSEVRDNSLGGIASYGGAASIQQGSARLVMNGGLVSGNSARSLNTNGIVVNKGSASFEMNGGVIDNGAHGVHLYESGTNGTLALNAGKVSGVTVDSDVSYGNNTQRHLFLKQGVAIDTGHASVAGRQVRPVSADFRIGNPSIAGYGSIKAALPQGWGMPAIAENIIGFWMKKDGTATFSVAEPPSGAPPDDYDRSLGIYFAAVQGTLADGSVDASSPVRFYPAALEGNRIEVTLPLKAYANGVTVALVQPSEEYGAMEFEGPEALLYDPKATGYDIHYTASYEMPENLYALLDADGHSNANTAFTLTIRPDGLTVPDIASLAIDSDLFEMGGAAVWDENNWELSVPLLLKDGWNAATGLVTELSFSCAMAAADFEDGGILSLTGHIAIEGENDSGNQRLYYIYGNAVLTEMRIPEGGLDGEEGISGGTGYLSGGAAPDGKAFAPSPGNDADGKRAWGVPRTGDSFSLGLWLAGLALGLLGLIAAHTKRNRAR